MIFIVALYTPWCRHLESLAGISPQLYADNLKRTSYTVDSVFAAAQYTVSYVHAVGQEASPSKCVLLSTSKAARRRMTSWRNLNEGCVWAVKLDVRDLGGHLDVTLRAVAGTLSNRVRIATTQVPAVGALTLGFQRMRGMVRSKYLLGGLHGCEGAAVSVTALSSFRSAIARAVWSKKLPMTNTPALLNLLDGPWGSDSAFFIVWSRFRQLRRYLAYRPEDEARIYRLLDYASTGSPGHGPIHLLPQSAEELGFFWDSEQAGWIRPGLPPLRMMTGPTQRFRSAISGRPGNIKLQLIFASGKVFGVALVLIYMALINDLFLPISGNETKCCFEPFFLVAFGTASYLVRLRKKTFPADSVVHLIMFFEIVLFPLLLSSETILSSFLF